MFSVKFDSGIFIPVAIIKVDDFINSSDYRDIPTIQVLSW